MLAAPAFAGDHELSLGTGAFSTIDFLHGQGRRYSVEAAYAYETGPWRFTGGVRFAYAGAFAPLPFELYARALFVAHIGHWAPAVGPELGLSGGSVLLPDRAGLPPDFHEAEAAQFGPGYVSIHTALLRFEFERFRISALEVQWGTNFPPLGATLRLELDFLHVGVRW